MCASTQLLLLLLLLLLLHIAVMLLAQRCRPCCYCCCKALHCVCQGLGSEALDMLLSNMAQLPQHLPLLLLLLLLLLLDSGATVQPTKLQPGSAICCLPYRTVKLLLLLLSPTLLLLLLLQLWSQLPPQQCYVSLLQFTCMLQQQALCSTPAVCHGCLLQQLHIAVCIQRWCRLLLALVLLLLLAHTGP
jgi:hypothetical protein